MCGSGSSTLGTITNSIFPGVGSAIDGAGKLLTAPQVGVPGQSGAQSSLEQAQLQDLLQSRQDIENFRPFVLQQYGLEDRNSLGQSERQAAAGQLQKAQASRQYWLDRIGQDPQAQQKADSYNPDIARYQSQAHPDYQKTAQQVANEAQLQAVQQQNLAIQKANNDRVQSAMNGTLAPNAAIAQQAAKDFRVLQQDQTNSGNEVVGDSLDNAVAKTTSGQQALAALKQSYSALNQNYIDSVIAGGANTQSAFQNQYVAGNTAINPGAPNASQGLAGLSGLYASAYQPYQYQQGMQFQANNANATNQTNMLTGLLGTAGKLGAAAMA